MSGSLPPSSRRTVLLVEDHPQLNRALAFYLNLQSEFVVCDSAFSYQEAIAAVARFRPDLAIVDLNLDGESGLELISLLHKEAPGLLVLVMSVHDEELFAFPALAAGARGFLMKQEAIKYLLKAMREILGGKIYLSENLRRHC